MDSDIPVVTFNYDELIPISQAKEGLELHSLTNCILCVSLSSLHGEQTGGFLEKVLTHIITKF